MTKKAAKLIANSPLLRRGKRVHESAAGDALLGGSYVDKALANLYLILNDYADGLFPPRLGSREDTFKQERDMVVNRDRPGVEDEVNAGMGKPANEPLFFLRGQNRGFERIVETLEKRGVSSGARLLECGCGQGWLSELLAVRGYSVTGTEIAPLYIKTAHNRTYSLIVKGLAACAENLDFYDCAMEEVFRHLFIDMRFTTLFDVVFCYAALHHTFSWKESLTAMDACLRPGGLLMLCDEPPRLHTWLAYRSSKALKTHEIGFNIRQVADYVKQLSYTDIEVTRPTEHLWQKLLPVTFGNGIVAARPWWLVARKK